jgi:hypothetical protein
MFSACHARIDIGLQVLADFLVDLVAAPTPSQQRGQPGD